MLTEALAERGVNVERGIALEGFTQTDGSVECAFDTGEHVTAATDGRAEHTGVIARFAQALDGDPIGGARDVDEVAVDERHDDCSTVRGGIGERARGGIAG